MKRLKPKWELASYFTLRRKIQSSLALLFAIEENLKNDGNGTRSQFEGG